jgi:uncharacterized protein (TIGR04255 family)
MKFEKPPLLELIAEFRWLPTNALGVGIANPATFLKSGPETEAFYDAFRKAVAFGGYNLSERLIPANFVHPMYQPVFRYSRDSDEKTPRTIYQVGIGLLSVHALPPYDSWSTFKPVISAGLDALIASRSTDKSTVFTSVSLRYIDAFDTELRQGRSERKFLSEVLGLNVDLPFALAEQAVDPDLIEVAAQLKTRTKSGLDLTLGVGPNVDQGDPHRIVMDTVVSSPQHVAWDREATLEVLERAHTAIRSLFVGMTTPIHDLMGLLTEGGK